MPGSSTTPALAAILAGAIVFEAARSKRSLMDTFLGKPAQAMSSPDRASTVALAATNSITAAAKGATAAVTKAGTATFDGHPVALWIIPQLKWCRKHGYWHGAVTSGWRDPREVVTPSPGLPVAPQGKSNHNTTLYPGGAVDVSDADGLATGLTHYPLRPRLVRGTMIGDPIHFSATGH